MATKPKKIETTIRTYAVLSPLSNGDVLYGEGDFIDMDTAEAAELVTAGVLRATQTGKAADADIS
ncbi:MAG: hypothetical protein Q8Q81_00475 [Oxalobacteraceae bacterium]|nr:hypothetical protein [Oxalobacteraceae bacterium]